MVVMGLGLREARAESIEMLKDSDFENSIEIAQKAQAEIKSNPLKYSSLFAFSSVIGYKLMQRYRINGLSGTLLHRMNVAVSKLKKKG
jgi:hypothetical protein